MAAAASTSCALKARASQRLQSSGDGAPMGTLPWLRHAYHRQRAFRNDCAEAESGYICNGGARRERSSQRRHSAARSPHHGCPKAGRYLRMTDWRGRLVFAYLEEPPFCFRDGDGVVRGCDVELAQAVLAMAGGGAFDPVEAEFAQ